MQQLKLPASTLMRALVLASSGTVGLLAGAGSLTAQDLAGRNGGLTTPTPDTASLAPDPGARLETLLEKTIFKVDVLSLHIRFGAETANRLERAATAGEIGRDALADSVATIALDSRDVWARIRFERDVRLDQFVDGVVEDLAKARRAGIIDETAYRGVSADLPRWFGFLENRRIRDGDQIWYRIRGDTLRTIYVGVDDGVLLDQTDVGPDRRLAVLGGYLAPGASLRKGLVQSFIDRRRPRRR